MSYRIKHAFGEPRRAQTRGAGKRVCRRFCVPRSTKGVQLRNCAFFGECWSRCPFSESVPVVPGWLAAVSLSRFPQDPRRESSISGCLRLRCDFSLLLLVSCLDFAWRLKPSPPLTSAPHSLGGTITSFALDHSTTLPSPSSPSIVSTHPLDPL